MTQPTDVSSPAAPSPAAPHARATPRAALWGALLLLGFPLATALAALVKTSVNIPETDDYDAIAGFLLRYTHTPGWLERIGWTLTSQHNEYKLMLLHTVVVGQYLLLGHTNYRALQLLGDLSIPATLWLLWLLLARQQRPFQQNLWLILLPWYLFLGLPYSETVNFAMNGLQSLAIMPLSIAPIFFFTSPIRRATLWGTLFLVISIATNANGFIVAFALLLVLIYQRRFRAALAAALAACVMGGLYRLHYTPMPAQHSLPPLGGGLTFALVFLGGICPTLLSCAVLGAILLAGFVFLLTRGWARLSPDTFCIALFCLITAAAIVPGRYREGLGSALSSRYSMYSLMLLSAEYLAVLRILVPRHLRLNSIWSAAIGFGTVAAIAFGISSQMHAYRELHARQRLLTTHLILWERHPERPGLATPYPLGDKWLPFRLHAQNILEQIVASRLFIPPVSAQDPLPLKPHSEVTVGIEDEAPPGQPAAVPH